MGPALSRRENPLEYRQEALSLGKGLMGVYNLSIPSACSSGKEVLGRTGIVAVSTTTTSCHSQKLLLHFAA